MKIAILGLGYVGLTAMACLAKDGHDVAGVDVNSEKVRQINSGVSPISEPGLDELLEAGLARKAIRCTTDPAEALEGRDMAIVCVGTPSAVDGSHNMSFIAEVSRQIASVLKRDPSRRLTVVYRSTIRPGTVDELVRPIFTNVLGKDDARVEIVYNPEFLRESVAIKDFFDPPKIVIGTRDGQPSAAMDEMNKGLEAPVFYTRYREAEITKFVDNTFHAVKITFANEIGRVCVELGIDPKVVHKIFVSDTKLNVSPYYLRPGGAFGGSCLPKDVRALQFVSADVGGNTHLVDSLIRSNEAHKNFLFKLCSDRAPAGGTILMLGLAFKKNSDDLRESPNLDLARKLLTKGYKLRVYDPSLHPEKLIGQNLGYAYSNLPQLSQILVDEHRVRADDFDLIVDANGTAAQLGLPAAKVLDINTL